VFKLICLGCDGDQDSLEQLKLKLLTLTETVAERDVLQHRVEVLEKELNAYHDLPEDVEVFKRRSVLLDDVLKDRDRLAKRVEQMRGLDEELLALKQKAERVSRFIKWIFFYFKCNMYFTHKWICNICLLLSLHGGNNTAFKKVKGR